MIMENENLDKKKLADQYRQAIEPIFRYIPWLEQNVGKRLSHMYQGEDSPKASFSVPVYDAMLLGFVKEMKATGLMDRNYKYIYSRNRIKTAEDEISFIHKASWKDREAVLGIMARYVLGGMTKGRLWVEAVENGVFLEALYKIKELLVIWDKPLA